MKHFPSSLKYSPTYLLLTFLITFTSQKCGFNYLTSSPPILTPHPPITTTSSSPSPLRIHLDYSHITSSPTPINQTSFHILKTAILPKALTILHSLISLKSPLPPSTPLTLPSPTCSFIPIPYHYQHPGINNTDLVLFISLAPLPGNIPSNIEASSSHCIQDATTFRPVAGFIHFNPSLPINTSPRYINYLTYLTLHELTHVLMFNPSLFHFFPNANTLSTITHPVTGITQHIITSANVLKHAKEHFMCENITGIPLEYHGDNSTINGHWSKRYMNTDYMIGDSYGENVISNITLALFEDSGWYLPNYTMSSLFLFGKNVSCGFFNASAKCVDEQRKGKVHTKYPNEFCTMLNYPQCSIGNVFRGNCKGRRYTHLEKHEQYFMNNEIAGADAMMDKCPIVIENEAYYGGSCRIGNDEGLDVFEKVCDNCICVIIEKTILNNNTNTNNKNLRHNKGTNYIKNAKMDNEVYYNGNELRTGCVEYECTTHKQHQTEMYIILNHKDSIIRSKCNYKGERLLIPEYKGIIIECPDPTVRCDKKYKFEYI